jgi:hypothetical protein
MKIETLNENDYFVTTDLSLCATLLYSGYSLAAINKQNPSKVNFLIERDERLDGLIQKYWAHQLTVEPLSFFNFLKEVKSRIYTA